MTKPAAYLQRCNTFLIVQEHGVGAWRDGVGVLVAPADGGSRPATNATGEGHGVPGLHDEAGQWLLNDGRNLKARVTCNLQSISQSVTQLINLSIQPAIIYQWVKLQSLGHPHLQSIHPSIHPSIH